MAWIPALYSVSGPVLEKNLLAWCEAEQAEALAWAKAELGFSGAVPNFSKVLNSSEGRILKNPPYLMLVRRTSKFAEPTDDFSFEVTHTLGFEIVVADSDADRLTERANTYGLAVMSMLYKAPHEVLAANMSTSGHPTVAVTDWDRDQTRGATGAFTQTPRLIAQVKLVEVRQ